MGRLRHRSRYRHRPAVESLEPIALLAHVGSAIGPGYTPAQIQAAYGFDQAAQQYGPGAEGRGVTIAVVELGNDPSLAHALKTYARHFHLPTPFLTTDSLGTGKMTRPWLRETALDIEAIDAVLPMAHIVIVSAGTSPAPGANTVSLLAADQFAGRLPGVNVVVNAWGQPDIARFPERPDLHSYSNEFFSYPATVASTVTFVASAGDQGYGATLYPAVSPYVIGVGATAIGATGQTTWAGSSWGADPYETVPGYQANLGTGADRMTPDVSMFGAMPGLEIFVPHVGWTREIGTSLSAPLFAGVVGAVDGVRIGRGAAPIGTTSLLADMYGLDGTPYWSLAFDPVGGVAGYTPAAGLGAPRVPGFVQMFA